MPEDVKTVAQPVVAAPVTRPVASMPTRRDELATELPMPCHYQARIDYVKEWDWAAGSIVAFVPVGSNVHAVIVPKDSCKLVSIDVKNVELGTVKPEKKA